MAAPFVPWWWIEAAGQGRGSTAQVSQNRPQAKTLPELVSDVLDCCPRRSRHFRQVSTLINILILQGFIRPGTSPNTYFLQNHIYVFDRPPTANDDRSSFYVVGSVWYDETTNILWICKDNTIGSAVWQGVSLSSNPNSTQGTVTNATGPSSFFEWSGANTDLLTASLKSQGANLVFASPVSGSGVPSFRAIDSADLAGAGGATSQVAGNSPYTGTTTNDYVQVFDFNPGTGMAGSLRVRNTGGSNTLRYKFEDTDVDGVVTDNDSVTLAAGASSGIVAMATGVGAVGMLGRRIMSIKSETADLHTTYRVDVVALS